MSAQRLYLCAVCLLPVRLDALPERGLALSLSLQLLLPPEEGLSCSFLLGLQDKAAHESRACKLCARI